MSSATTEDTSRRTLRAHRREIRNASRELARSTRSTLDDVTLAWRLQVERNPYLSLGAVFAVGYVLGGGVPLRLVRFAAGTGARMAASMVLREMLSGSFDLSALYQPRDGNGDDASGEGGRRRAAGAARSGSGASA